MFSIIIIVNNIIVVWFAITDSRKLAFSMYVDVAHQNTNPIFKFGNFVSFLLINFFFFSPF